MMHRSPPRAAQPIQEIIVNTTSLQARATPRAVAFVLSGLMAAAYFSAHAPQGNARQPILTGGEPDNLRKRAPRGEPTAALELEVAR
jgi:hypothetical protein